MAFVSVTRLHLRSWRTFPAFLWYATRSQIQARGAEGNLAVALRRARDGSFWTLSVWRDQAAMRGFMLSGPHRKAMPHLKRWCDEASVTHWDQESGARPAWTEAEARLGREGRLSAVDHPSTAHAAGHTLGGRG